MLDELESLLRDNKQNVVNKKKKYYQYRERSFKHGGGENDLVKHANIGEIWMR